MCSGVLLVIGRPDGRIFSQTKAESWILLAIQQAKAIVHLGAPPEVVTVGHNPYHKASVIDRTLVLSQTRPSFVCETLPALLEDSSTEPMRRMATFKHSATQPAAFPAAGNPYHLSAARRAASEKTQPTL